MQASLESGGSSLSQHSQLGRNSSDISIPLKPNDGAQPALAIATFTLLSTIISQPSTFLEQQSAVDVIGWPAQDVYRPGSCGCFADPSRRLLPSRKRTLDIEQRQARTLE